MNSLHLINNLQLKSESEFTQNDPHLSRLRHQKWVNYSELIYELPRQEGVYTLGGGRQIGKTTLLKQWMLYLMKDQVDANHIRFITGEIIDDHHHLIRELSEELNVIPENKIKYFIIDEVTYIKDWDKAIKFLVDTGRLKNTVLVLSGSDLLMIQEARMRFPGRRGKHPYPDFHCYPLNFKETLQLKLNKKLDKISKEEITEGFNEYLIHGGFLTAINEWGNNKQISDSVLNIYSDWIRGDLEKKGKQEQYLHAIVIGIIKRYGSTLTWNSLAKELPIDHPSTIADYIDILKRMDVLCIQETLQEDKLMAAPKKGRKIFFNDPFILRAMLHFIKKVVNFDDPEFLGHVVESVVVSHFKRKYETFMIQSEGEIDVVYLNEKQLFPIEVKWTEQVRAKDLKQIKKYKNSVIWSKHEELEADPKRLFLPKMLAEFF